MDKLLASLQLLASALLAIIAIATVVNLVLISTRPETVSVINAMIGLGLIAIFLAALSRILFRKGMRGLKGESAPDRESD